MGVETIPIQPSRDFDETIGFYALLRIGGFLPAQPSK